MAEYTRNHQLSGTSAPSPDYQRAQSAPSNDAAAPPENANAMPGGTMNTAGGKMREASVVDAIKSIKVSDFKEVHKKPCVRESLMVGIGSGFGIGSLRAVLGASVLASCNWAVGSFVFGSFLMHEYCQRKRFLEMQGMKRVVEVIDRKKTEKQLKAQSKNIGGVTPEEKVQ